MRLFRYRGRFVQGVLLFLRVLVSYKLLALRNTFLSSEQRKTRLKRLHSRNAFMLRERMVEMRGVLIKIGQFMSSRVDILPEEYTDELSKLQDRVPPTPFRDIALRVTTELGPLDEVFSSFDEKPIASASLGQVHRACLRDGEDCIVVKVQYPGIEEVIAADIRMLRFVVGILGVLFRQINFELIYTEFSRIIFEELDYIQEGKNAEAFAKNFSGNPHVKIPAVYWPYTTKKVLTLEYLEGVKVIDFDELDAQGIDRKETARALAKAYCQMLFSDGLFHGDPHPGNIFVRPGPVLVLVDFGMVGRIRGPLRDGLRRGFAAVVERDSLGLVRALVDLGFIPLSKDLQPLVLFVDRILEKYRDISPGEFKAMDLEEIGRDIQEALQLNPAVQIPNDFFLFGRVLGMLNGLGSRLDPETNIIEIAAPFASRFMFTENTTAEGFLTQAGTAIRSLPALPKLLTDFLVTTDRGETKVKITSQDIAEELRSIAGIGRGAILSLLVVGAGLAAVVFRISHFDAESEWAAIVSGVLLVWLLLALRKK